MLYADQLRRPLRTGNPKTEGTTEKELNDLSNKQKKMTLMIQEKHQSISHLTQEITKDKNIQ